MLKALTSFFNSPTDAVDTSTERELELATAVLLIEVARADFSEDDIEIHAVAELLERHLNLPARDVHQLVEQAQREADHAASLQAFTRQLHEELGNEDKFKIVEMLWQVALADATLDKHEDHLIRKIAGLLYISHSDLIRIRNRVSAGQA